MARPIGLSLTAVSAARSVTGAPVAADSATLTDANFPLVASDTTGGSINGFGFSTIWLNAEFAGGTAPTVTVDLLVRDDGAADGSRWKRLVGVPATLLDGSGFIEVRVDGALVYPRLSAVTGSPTTVTLLARPGARLPGRAFY